ncbi:MAG: VWA domain-containing protein, partial [Planctomycetota bacterium]
LALTGDAAATNLVLSRVNDPEPLVREAVARAIRTLGAKKHLLHVVGMLKDPRLRVIAAAREVLEAMTGQKFGFDAAAWEMWLLDPEKRPAKPPAGGESVSRYYGMEILSDRVLFLVDTSGSMNAGKPSRIEVARKELATTLSRLNRRTVFSVAGFGGSPRWWSDRARPATPATIADAKKFVEGLSVGGETNLFDALVQALDRHREADTIFLLGDGCPSAGKVTEHDGIRVRIRWLNRMRKLKIHSIAFVDRPVPLNRPRTVPARREEDAHEAADLLLRLAEENAGTYVRREN